MRVLFWIDPETGEPHILGHGVSEEEAEFVFRFPSEDRPGQSGARVSLGQTEAGRYLRVVYRLLADGNAIIITAFDLTGQPLRAFKRRRKRKK